MTGTAIAKYLNERIPRYTSYPTAPHFSAAVGPASYRDWLKGLPETERLSLYLHIPFCTTLCWYCGCNTSITRHRAPIERYVDSLKQEIVRVAALAGSHRVAHIHWGGGTPTIVGPELFRSIMDLLRDRFDVEPDAEIAVEVDPRRLDGMMTTALAISGVTRASLGVQSFDPQVQKAVARVQSLSVTKRCVELLRGAGIQAINLDLLYGLPHETVATCKATVEAALTLNPARFSVFGYAHVPSMMKHQRVIDATALPDADERLRQEQAIGDALVRAGYMRIGLDHYARPSDPLAQARLDGNLRRNFQGYTDDPADALIGFGASSIGLSRYGYVQNITDLKGWRDRIEAGELATARGLALTPDDGLRGEIIERLMCDLRVDVPNVLRRRGFPSDYFDAEIEALKPLVADGLTRIDHGVITVPEAMRNLVRRVASVFDAYLDPTAGRHAVAV
ncbi:MAG TPA: oxygen-independent coproporphyrinogen III oxidase [Acetobacteraceae bacterium]|jgi:oxygen-independent coproporphyrinogen III oxidase|nr:oxygen-independent coproporphyrinogen III oxidase [Acetobacteraceae bacterium]